jgi:hypothetical protein
MYIPIFYGILTEEQFQHLIYLSSAMFLLYKNNIMPDKIEHARNLLSKIWKIYMAYVIKLQISII